MADTYTGHDGEPIGARDELNYVVCTAYIESVGKAHSGDELADLILTAALASPELLLDTLVEHVGVEWVHQQLGAQYIATDHAGTIGYWTTDPFKRGIKS